MGDGAAQDERVNIVLPGSEGRVRFLRSNFCFFVLLPKFRR